MIHVIWCTYRLTAGALGLHGNVRANITLAADKQKYFHCSHPNEAYKVYVDSSNGRTTDNVITANSIINLPFLKMK